MTQQNTNYHITSLYRCIDCVNTLDSDLYIMTAGVENCKPDKKIGPSFRKGYHIHVILSGKGTLWIDKQPVNLSAGQIFVVPNHTETRYEPDPKDPWQYAWLTINGKNARTYLSYAGFKNSWVRNCNCSPNRFLEIIDKIIGATELTMVNELKRNSCMFEFLALLAETKDPVKEIRHDFSPDLYVQYATQFIHLNYASIKVNDIAAYIGINRSYLATIFKNKLHISPQEYLLNYRLNKAKQLLCTTELPIQEISARVGYDNPLTFSKMFKNAFGKSPKHYRLEMQDNPV